MPTQCHVDILEGLNRITCGDVVLVIEAVRNVTCRPNPRVRRALCARINFDLLHCIQFECITYPLCVGQETYFHKNTFDRQSFLFSCFSVFPFKPCDELFTNDLK
ncbi:MAG: hypothetical protein UY39_C0010G0019 [Candidatus Kaiserbacteria bacterium GW2011_GWC2_49_12]|uniref:Uncharacterized protein n=1 Tax=Candidatus Kaiserbacteria bacterium GW2011_GWC2_49_12 TaxID=1618675 RepID=A0A0G1VML0_9BACT|nr:MAG: hypothetical protein UY39_C0010G0019 [Candidatus Kaiserbacteria bacterium GW2011_GWC2_49_12]